MLVRHFYLHAVLQQPVDIAVGVDGDLPGAVLCDLLDGLSVCVGRRAGVQPLQRSAQPARQDDLRFTLARLGAQRTKGFGVQVLEAPAQRGQQVDGWHLDQRQFAVAGGDLTGREAAGHRSGCRRASHRLGRADVHDLSVLPHITGR